MIKVSNLKSPNGNKVANQFEISIGSTYIFQSYESTIAIFNTFDNTKIINEDYYKYSATTTKYTTIFFECESTKELHKMVKDGDIKLVSGVEFSKMIMDLY